MYDYRGAIHLHSTYSDGHGQIDEIMRCANEVGLDFVILTDHDTTAPYDDGHEKWHESTALICGMEITPPKNHYIAFGPGKLKQAKTLRQKSPQEYIDAVAHQGFLGFIAHPHHAGTERFGIPPLPWEAWDAAGFTGIGLWDLQTDWQSKLDREDLTMDLYDNFPKYLSGPHPETLKRWDEMNQTRRVVGIGEIDNHKKPKEVGERTLEIFPYDTAFRTINNHILLEAPLHKEFEKAKAQILEAIGAGRLYVSFDYWADPAEFVFQIEEEDQVGQMGDEFKLQERAELVVSLPGTADLVVLRNGKPIHAEADADEALLDVPEPGVYRVEARQNGLTWILSNPIRVVKD
jgi:hypothetical protein